MDKFDKKIITFYTFFWVVVILIVGSIVTCVYDMELKRESGEGQDSVVYTPYYNSKIGEFEEQNKTLTNVDVCFLGDGLIENYEVENYYENLNVVNRGIKGDTTLSLKSRLNVSAGQINPKVVVMLIGANNLNTMFENQNYEMLLRSLKSELPQSKIIVLSLIPNSGKYACNNETILENNKKIKSLQKYYFSKYVDIYTPLLDETLELNSSFTTDGKSLNTSGYEALTNIVKPVVLEVLKK